MTARARANQCGANAAALLELLDDPVGRALTGSARAHLDSCRDCQAEFGSLVLAGRQVTRTFAAAQIAEPPAGAWPRLQARVQRRPPNLGRAASPLLGLALGAGLAVALLVPVGAMRVGPSSPTPVRDVIDETSIEPSATVAAGPLARDDEARPSQVIPVLLTETPSSETMDRARLKVLREELALGHVRHTGPRRALSASAE